MSLATWDSRQQTTHSRHDSTYTATRDIWPSPTNLEKKLYGSLGDQLPETTSGHRSQAWRRNSTAHWGISCPRQHLAIAHKLEEETLRLTGWSSGNDCIHPRDWVGNLNREERRRRRNHQCSSTCMVPYHQWPVFDSAPVAERPTYPVPARPDPHSPSCSRAPHLPTLTLMKQTTRPPSQFQQGLFPHPHIADHPTSYPVPTRPLHTLI